jgi:hypothetical protein
MIVYDLACDKNHPFEGWFGSTDDFNLQVEAGDIACPFCGSIEIKKRLSAPYVHTHASDSHANARPDHRKTDRESETVSVVNAAQELKRKFVEHVLNNTEDVGPRFSEEARRIFYKEAPGRAIRGTASSEEVSELKEEGIDVMAIPGTLSLPEKLH